MLLRGSWGKIDCMPTDLVPEYLVGHVLLDDAVAYLKEKSTAGRKQWAEYLDITIFESPDYQSFDTSAISDVLNVLLPHSQSVFDKILYRARYILSSMHRRRFVYEIAFATFVRWSEAKEFSDVHPIDMAKEEYFSFCLQNFAKYLSQLHCDVSLTGWMAAHALGYHWANTAEAYKALRFVVFNARYAVARKLAITPGLEELFDRSSKGSRLRSRINRTLEKVAGVDRSNIVKRWARSLLERIANS